MSSNQITIPMLSLSQPATARTARSTNRRPKRLSTYNPYWTGSTDSEDGPTIYIGDSDEEAVVTYPPNWPRRKPADPDYDADGEDAAMPKPRRRVLKKKVISFKFAAPICRTASFSMEVDQAVMGDVASIANPYLAAWVSDVCDVCMSDGNNNLDVTVQSNYDCPNEQSNPENASAIAVPTSEPEAVLSPPKESAAASSPLHVHESKTGMSETSLKPQFDDNGPNSADAMEVPDYQWIEAIDTCLDVDASDEFPAPPPILTSEVDNRDALFKDSDGMDYEASANIDARAEDPGTTVKRTLSQLGEENVPPKPAQFKDPLLDFANLTQTNNSIFKKSEAKKRRIVQRKAEKKSPVSVSEPHASVVGLLDRRTTSSLFMNWIDAPIIRRQPCPYLPTKNDDPLDDPMN